MSCARRARPRVTSRTARHDRHAHSAHAALTPYGDLDVSVIDELPPGRTPVKTVVLTGRAAMKWYSEFAPPVSRAASLLGCPLIDESEEMPYQAAEEPPTALAAACRN